MSPLELLLHRQKSGARFVISAPILGMDVTAFDALAQTWLQPKEGNGQIGFSIVGVPFRKVINGVFLIQRLTALKD